MKINDLLLWQTFLTVAQEKNFSKAARILKTKAPNVTKRITNLEEQLGSRLFNRTTRVVSLTTEGESLIPHVKVLVDQVEELERHTTRQKEISGLIRLTCVQAFAQRWLAPHLAEFAERYPLIQLEVEPTDRLVNLVDEQIDLAIRIQEPKGADFIFKELIRNEISICASPDYLKKHSGVKTPEDLTKHQLLTLTLHENLRFHNSKLRLRDVSLRKSIRCESGSFLNEMALQGYGIAIRSSYDVEPYLKSGQLVPLLKKYPLEDFRKIYIVIPQKRYLSSRVRTLFDFLIGKAQNNK